MSKHDPRVTLRQIAEYAKYAQELCSGTTLTELVQDWRSALDVPMLLKTVEQMLADIEKPSDH